MNSNKKYFEELFVERLFEKHLFETLYGASSFELHCMEFEKGKMIPTFSLYPGGGRTYIWKIHCSRIFEYRLEGRVSWRFNYLCLDQLAYYDLGLKSNSEERPNFFLNFAPGFIAAYDYRYEFIGIEQWSYQPLLDF